MKVILIATFVVHLVLGAENGPEVRVKNGLLRGANLETKKGRKFLGFTGIRYAKPPVEGLRFLPPVPMDDWSGTKDATKDHDMCIQTYTIGGVDGVAGVEDCLFLNVYTPKIGKTHLLPVMMFIHGGGYHFLSGNKRSFGPDTLLNKDVVLVTINYRLGALGFLTTGDEVVPGNNGLKDQTLALQWIKQNIRNFGGDPNSVTIFGQSAGAGSTHFHMLSPLSKGLFHGAISQSGTAFARWNIQPLRRGVQVSRRLAERLNCSMGSSREMMASLRKLDAKDITRETKQYPDFGPISSLIFAPVVERKHIGAFISDSPEHITKHCLGSDVPWLVGITREDGGLKSAPILSNPKLLEEFNDNFAEKGHVALFMDQSDNTKKVSKKLLEYYFGNSAVDASNGKSLTNLYTDAYYAADTDKAVSLHKKYNKQPIYNYLFGFRGSMSLSEIYSGTNTDYGVCHGDDILYLFPVYETFFPGRQPTEDDLKMTELLSTLWTNFAKHKNPTPYGFLSKWKPVKSAHNEYLHIKQDHSLVMERDMFKQRMQFWKTLEPLLKVDYSTN